MRVTEFGEFCSVSSREEGLGDRVGALNPKTKTEIRNTRSGGAKFEARKSKMEIPRIALIRQTARRRQLSRRVHRGSRGGGADHINWEVRNPGGGDGRGGLVLSERMYSISTYQLQNQLQANFWALRNFSANIMRCRQLLRMASFIRTADLQLDSAMILSGCSSGCSAYPDQGGGAHPRSATADLRLWCLTPSALRTRRNSLQVINCCDSSECGDKLNIAVAKSETIDEEEV